MSCYCHNCKKYFHPLGIMRHRSMHRDRKEKVTITFSNGKTYSYDFSRPTPQKDGEKEDEK